jgi:cell division protein FtsW (lipid II flippase)
MKLRKGDYVFVIVYLIILFSLLFVTPATTVVESSSGVEESSILWGTIVWVLLYAIAVPIIYFLIRKYLYPKKKTD